jgi:hypothetical protein
MEPKNKNLFHQDLLRKLENFPAPLLNFIISESS